MPNRELCFTAALWLDDHAEMQRYQGMISILKGQMFICIGFLSLLKYSRGDKYLLNVSNSMPPSAHFEVVSLLSRFPLDITLCESLNYISAGSFLEHTIFPLH